MMEQMKELVLGLYGVLSSISSRIGPGTTDGLQIFNPFFEMIEKNYAKK